MAGAEEDPNVEQIDLHWEEVESTKDRTLQDSTTLFHAKQICIMTIHDLSITLMMTKVLLL